MEESGYAKARAELDEFIERIKAVSETATSADELLACMEEYENRYKDNMLLSMAIESLRGEIVQGSEICEKYGEEVYIKISEFSEIFRQPLYDLEDIVQTQIGEYPCNIYKFSKEYATSHPLCFYRLAEIFCGEQTRYFACEHSWEMSFMLCEWVIENGEEVSHGNYGTLINSEEDLENGDELLIEKLANILK